MAYSPLIAERRKNDLLDQLKAYSDLNFSDFGIKSVDEHNNGILAWTIFNKKKPAIFFKYFETVPFFIIEYFPPENGTEIRKIQYEKKGQDELVFATLRNKYAKWMELIRDIDREAERSRRLEEEMNPLNLFSPEDMEKPFQSIDEKILIGKGVKEFKYRITESRKLGQDKKDKLNQVADVTLEELDAIPIEEGQETKKSFMDRFKERINNVLNGLDEYILTPIIDGIKEGVKEEIKDLAKKATKKIVKYAIVGGSIVGGVSMLDKMEVFIIFQNSFHMIKEPEYSLPLPFKLFRDLDSFQFEDQQYEIEYTESKPKSFWQRLLGN